MMDSTNISGFEGLHEPGLPVRAVVCTVCDSVFIPGETLPCTHLQILAESCQECL